MTGDRGEALAIGPTVLFQHKIENAGMLMVEARYVREISTENRPEGDAFWLKATYGF